MNDRQQKCIRWFKKQYPNCVIDNNVTVDIIFVINKPKNPQAPYVNSTRYYEKENSSTYCSCCDETTCEYNNYYLVILEERLIATLLDNIINRYY